MKHLLAILLIALSITGCISKSTDYDNALSTINITDLQSYVSALGADSFLGRKPFTPGETITVNYLAEQLKKIGYEPAFNGSYFQEVPMVEITSVASEVTIRGGKDLFKLDTPDEAAIISPQVTKRIDIENSEMIFAGFGIIAPEYGWNDYEGFDVKGKTVVVLINDPGLYSGDSTLFKGREMTYYGRWTYKYEEAARQGATGIIIIHETEGAGYQYTIPRKSALSPKLYMQQADSNSSMCAFTGWFSAASADNIFASIGLRVNELRLEACKKDYKGFPMNMEISLSLNNEIKYNKSINVAGILRGSKRPDECIVYTAHWDHFGIGEKENGDTIYNGAVDNGTSMAWEFEIGEAFSKLKTGPERSILLLFPTAEEQGLYGSLFYTENPVFLMEKTVACINNDLMLPIGRMKDVMITGFGQSELDDIVAKAASEQDRYVVKDPNSHTGMYFRSDHFAFARKGVPSLFARGNIESREFGKEWTAQQEKDYIDNKYHRPSDNYNEAEWDLEGIAEDAKLSFMIGYELANMESFPAWKSGSEFRNLRK
jgi:Zn-dependent M28 family amino/carboxypeptidase